MKKIKIAQFAYVFEGDLFRKNWDRYIEDSGKMF
jgi:hypothetical protein